MAEPANHITCQQLVELVSDYLERALPTDDAAQFEQHLNYCDGCERYVDEMRMTIATGSRLREEHLPSEALEKLLTAFRKQRQS